MIKNQKNEDKPGKGKFYELVFKSLLPGSKNEIRAIKTCEEMDRVYEVYEQIGSGSYATVRRCVHKKSRKVLAVKIIEKKQFSYNNPKRWADQVNEATMLERLNHPNIVKLEEIFLTDDALYMVLEFVKVRSYVSF